MKKFFLLTLLILFFSAGIQLSVKAQPGDPDPDAVPLDPGSWVLVAAGVGYGIKKMRETRRQNKKNITGSSETGCLPETETDKIVD